MSRCFQPDTGPIPHKESILAKNQNTFEKMRREQEKKRKAKEKRERRDLRKEEGGENAEPAPVVDRFDLMGED